MSVTWLLYAFYTLMTEYFIHSGSGAYRKVQEAKPRLPPSIYFLILSIAWFPHFILLLQANNPYRNRAISFMITGTGLLVQHFVAGTIIYLKVYRWRIAPADSSLKKIAIFEAILSGTPIIAGLFSSFGYVLGLFCLYSSSLLTLMRTSAMLCAAMDLAFVLMFFKHVRNKDGFFERFKKSCKAHTRGILNHPHQKQLDPDDIRKFSSEPASIEAGNDQVIVGSKGDGGSQGDGGAVSEQPNIKTQIPNLKPQIGIPIVVHVSYAGVVPTQNQLAYFLSHHLLAGAIYPRRLVVTSVKVLSLSRSRSRSLARSLARSLSCVCALSLCVYTRIHAHKHTRARACTHTHTHRERERERERYTNTHTQTQTGSHACRLRPEHHRCCISGASGFCCARCL